MSVTTLKGASIGRSLGQNHTSPVVILSCNSTAPLPESIKIRTGRILLLCLSTDWESMQTFMNVIWYKADVQIFILRNETAVQEKRGFVDEESIIFIPLSPNFSHQEVLQRLGRVLRIQNEKARTQRKHGFNGTTLRIGVKGNYPMMDYHTTELISTEFSRARNKEVQRKEVLDTSGVDILLLSTIAQELNFTYRFFETSDGHVGSPIHNGSFSGLIGDLQDNFVDIALGAISRTSERQEAVSFSYPYFIDFNCFMTRAPKRNSNAFIIFGPYSQLTHPKEVHRSDAHRLSSSLLLTLQIITCVSAHNQHRRRNASQILLSLWILSALVLSAAYAGSIVSFFAASNQFEKTLDSLEDLTNALESGKYHVLYRPGTSAFSAFEDAEWGPYRTIREGYFREVTPSPYNDVNFKYILENEHVAFITTEIAAKFSTASLGIKHRFHFGKARFVPMYKAIAFQKRFPYIEWFNDKMMKLMTCGIVDAWLQAAEDREERMSRQQLVLEKEADVHKNQRITVLHLQGAFYLLLIGLSCGGLCFVWELIRHNKRYVS
ncbi:unnamed protein product [Cyprideis torosa]|uniref:Uncharacterized protein n=1 Tax=Cyprideis torosa TaxID=163714 RepID=A0A7R8WIA9_9CRUS|nr:unnamed protein product [Cyprideis torosa]CAG0900494.1 unnamed protein product [Cyprideis torosa]